MSNENNSQATPRHVRQRKMHWRIALGLTVLVGLVFAVPASARGWWGRHHHEPTLEDVREHLSHGVERVLGRVDATDAQRAEVDRIIGRVAPRILELKAEGRNLREKLVPLMAAEDIDVGEATRLKAEIDVLVDRASSLAFDALIEVANVLSPGQRAELAEEWQKWHR